MVPHRIKYEIRSSPVFRSILFPSLVAIGLLSCAKKLDVNGMWQNHDGNRITFMGADSAVLGQQGLEGGERGTYTVLKDTIRVVTNEGDSQGKMVYMFVMREGRLYISRVTNERPGAFQSMDGEQFAKQFGKTPEQLAFSRKSK